MTALLTGGQKHFTRGPGKFIVMHELISIMGDFLIGAVPTMRLDGPFEKSPARSGLFQVERAASGNSFLNLGDEAHCASAATAAAVTAVFLGQTTCGSP